MKWLVVVSCVVCLVHLSEAGVLATKSKPDSTVKLIEDSDDGVLKKGRDCEPGTKWMNRCNSCFCTEQGLVSCTKNDCPGMESVEEVLCAEDSEWKKDCNSCWCLGGIAQCTKMACGVIEYVDIDAYLANKSKTTTEKIPAAKPEVKTENSLSNTKTKAVTAAIEYINEEKAGLPKTSTEIPQTTELFSERSSTTTVLKEQSSQQPLSKGGNTEDRIVFDNQETFTDITENSELEDEIDDSIEENVVEQEHNNIEEANTTEAVIETRMHKVIKRAASCKPNQDFLSDCNVCKCSNDGHSYSCTQNECMEGENTNKEVEVFMENEGVDHIERHSVCKPRSTFVIGCNTCYCNYDGTDYDCTNKPCPLPKDVEVFHELREMKSIIPYTSKNVTKTESHTKL